MSLTEKQERFAQEYVVDCNATQAAIRAGYAPNAAQEQSSRLLSKAIVKARVRELQEKVAERTAKTAEDVIRGLWREAEQTGVGASHSARVSAYGLLAKHFGLLVERHEHSGPGAGPIPTRIEWVVVDRPKDSDG